MLRLPPLALLFALAPFTRAQTDPLLGERFEYVVYLGEEECGREKITLAADGWSAEGRYDFMGVRKGSYHASLRHGEGGRLEYEFASDEGGKERSLYGSFAAGEWSVSAGEREKKTAIADALRLRRPPVDLAGRSRAAAGRARERERALGR